MATPDGRVPDRARLHGRGAGARRAPSGRPRPSGRSRTSRSPAGRIDRALIRALARSRGRRRWSTPGSRRARRPRRRTPSTPRPTRWPTGALGRPVPDRRLPDRLGHLVEHERQRGHRHAGLGAARRRAVHPNDHVNASQSSNDVFPSAIHLAVGRSAVAATCCPPLDHLAARAAGQGRASSPTVVKSGRTHLMDATPVTLGQEFGGYAAQIEQGAERLAATLPRASASCRSAAPPSAPASTRPTGFARGGHRAPGRPDLDLPLIEAPDHFAAQGARDALVELSGQLRRRWPWRSQDRQRHPLDGLAGPAPGWPRSASPTSSPGSSIMPGKVNPVLPEAVTQVAAQVHRQRRRRRLRRQPGQLRAQRVPAGDGPQPAGVDPPAGQRDAASSPTAASPASRPTSSAAGPTPSRARRSARRSTPYIGYEKAAEVIKESVEDRPLDPRDRARAGLMLDEADLDRALDVLAMTKGGIRR